MRGRSGTRYLVRMRNGLLILIAAILLAGIPARPVRAAATSSGDLQKEYEQVRKIALKDPRVQEAFQKAQDRLDDRILQIDPSLKPIVDREKNPPAAAIVAPRQRFEDRAAVASTPEGRQHIVVKGETVSSIAAHYKVKVAALEKINHITDDRKLQVGQKLAIPGSEVRETQPAATATPAETRAPAAEAASSPGGEEAQGKDNGGLWDRVKSALQ